MMSAGDTNARRQATIALADAASKLYLLRKHIRENVLVSCGVDDGYTVADAASLLGMTIEDLNTLVWGDGR